MSTLFHCITSDYKKTKRMSIRIVHLIIPLCVVGIFLIYYAYAPWDAKGKLEAFFQVIGIGFPTLIGLFCAILSEQEASAASYQSMLASPKRLPMFYGKLLLLILGGAFSILLTSALFGIGNIYVIKQSIVQMPFYLLAALILIASSIVLYTVHLFLALRFNKGISIIAGILESLISALFLTGLGENLWYYLPCAWTPHFITHILSVLTGTQVFDTKCIVAIVLCAILTIFTVLLFGIWAYRWEGEHASD